jgi:hypothetical protein
MEYIITPEKLDKIMKPYFDKVFEHTEWSDAELDGQSWYGFFNQDGEMLVGHPEHDNTIYFTDGRYFNNMWDFFSIDSKEFTDAMGRYLKKKYGCEFDKIW